MNKNQFVSEDVTIYTALGEGAATGLGRMTLEKELDAAYAVLFDFVRDKQGRNANSVGVALGRRGITVNNEAGLLELLKRLSEYITYIKRDGLFYFYFAGAEQIQKTQKRSTWPAVFTFLVILIFVCATVWSVVYLWNIGFFYVKNSVPQTSRVKNIVAVEPAPAPIANSAEKNAIDSLIAGNLFSEVKDIIDGQGSGLSIEEKKNIRNQLYVLIPSRADSLEKVIKSMMASGRHKEAFLMEMKFDKDVFQLVGGNNSYRLRSELVNSWVYSYKVKKYEKSAAVRAVTADLRKIYGSRCYSAAKDSSGKYYPKYDRHCR